MTQYIRPELLEKFEFHNYGHALEILSQAFPNEWNEIQDCLLSLKITSEDLLASGGQRNRHPQKI